MGIYKPTNPSYENIHISLMLRFKLVFTARRYASAGLPIGVWPTFRLSVHPSHAGIVSKRLNIGSRKQQHTI